MNKYLVVFLICLPTCSIAVPSKPYDIINEIVQSATDDDVVAYGTHNDVLIKTRATNALQAIYAQKHNSDFWSRYTVLEMGGADSLSDNCFINFQYDIYTEYRLFCGNVSDYSTEHRTVTIRKPTQVTSSETK